jgi:hypothetical protein
VKTHKTKKMYQITVDETELKNLVIIMLTCLRDLERIETEIKYPTKEDKEHIKRGKAMYEHFAAKFASMFESN